MDTFKTSSKDQQFKTLSKHPKYYLPGGDLHILVGDTQFRVHEYFFLRESAKFQKELTRSVSPGTPRQGTEGAALVLTEVRPEDFASFISVFYNPKYSIYDLAIPEWTAILKLSDEWLFREVKDLAVRQLERHKMLLVNRIALYERYHVDEETLVPFYAGLCVRDEPISLDEGGVLGMRTALLIFQAREVIRAQLEGRKRADMVVREIFEIKMPDVQENGEDPSKASSAPTLNVNGRTSLGKKGNADQKQSSVKK